MLDRPFALALVPLAATLAPLARTLAPAPAPHQDDVPEDVADVPCQDLLVGENARQRYFLIGGPAPDVDGEGASPRKLLVVLPGGDGSAGFNAFVRRIWRHALSAEWLVAQLVAPRWADEQAESLVWPTARNPWPGMEFSTEEFVAAVIADVEERRAVDLACVFTLSWSSGGPAAYATSLTEGTRVSGTFVAMSVYKPDQLPGRGRAKGHAYYLLHSPDDFIPIRMAEAARKELTAAGAAVELATYEGGHGWRGDVWGNLRAGVRWLEEHRADPPQRKRGKR